MGAAAAAVPDSPITRALGAAAGWSSSSAGAGATPTHLASVVGGSGVKIFRRYATTARPLLPASAATTTLLSPATRTSTFSDQHHMAETTGGSAEQPERDISLEPQQRPDCEEVVAGHDRRLVALI